MMTLTAYKPNKRGIKMIAHYDTQVESVRIENNSLIVTTSYGEEWGISLDNYEIEIKESGKPIAEND